MTWNLLSGHKKFVSPDPHRASETDKGGGFGGLVRANKMSVDGTVTAATVAALQFHLRLSFLLPEGRLLCNSECSRVHQYGHRSMFVLLLQCLKLIQPHSQNVINNQVPVIWSCYWRYRQVVYEFADEVWRLRWPVTQWPVWVWNNRNMLTLITYRQ